MDCVCGGGGGEGGAGEAQDLLSYRKIPKSSDTRKFAVITMTFEQDGFSLE